MMRITIIFLIVAMMLSALAVIHAKHRNRMLYVELRDLQGIRDDLNVEWGRLQLEQSTWATHSRVEAVARKKLGMRSINYDEVIILKP